MNHVFLKKKFNGKPGHRGPTHPILMENSINFFFFFLKPSLRGYSTTAYVNLKTYEMIVYLIRYFQCTEKECLYEDIYTPVSTLNYGK